MLGEFVRRRWRVIGIAFAFLLLLFAFLLFYEPSSPDGIYYDPNLACEHGFWMFKDGKILAGCEAEETNFVGTYFKSGNQWINGTRPTNQTIIKPFLFGVKLKGPGWKDGQEFFLRDRFSWMYDCKDWIQLHLLP